MEEIFNEVWRRFTLFGTSLGNRSQVLANIRGLAENEDDDGEREEKSLLYGVVGLLVRPKAKSATGAAIGFAAVSPDGLSPVATFDPRISEARGEIAEGTVSLAGYEGQHVTLQEGTLTNKPKIVIEVNGARIVVEQGASSSTVDVTGVGVAENVALYSALQQHIIKLQSFIDLLCVGDEAAVPPVPGILPTLIAASVLDGATKTALTTALSTMYAQVVTTALAATNPAVASSAVLRASPT